MKNLIRKFLFQNLNPEDVKAVSDDILEDNRKSVIVYSSVVSGGMLVLLFLSLWLDVLASSRVPYMIAIAIGLVLLLLSCGPARQWKGLVLFCQYFLNVTLLAFGIILGTVVEPNQASASYDILLFAVPMLFTDLAYRINFMELISILGYIIAAKLTQSPEMFNFNLSVVLPYGLANMAITYFSGRTKIEKFIYAREKKLMGEYDRLTGMLNRWTFENDVEELKRAEKDEVCGVCAFDVNSLKIVNDTYGHKAGDELLIAAGKAIEKIFGRYGRCYRIGGDEFEAIVTDVFPKPEELIRMLNKETARYRGSYGFHLSISSGVVAGNSADIDKLISEADHEMYLHKRNHYHIGENDRRNNDI